MTNHEDSFAALTDAEIAATRAHVLTLYKNAVAVHEQEEADPQNPDYYSYLATTPGINDELVIHTYRDVIKAVLAKITGNNRPIIEGGTVDCIPVLLPDHKTRISLFTGMRGHAKAPVPSVEMFEQTLNKMNLGEFLHDIAANEGGFFLRDVLQSERLRPLLIDPFAEKGWIRRAHAASKEVRDTQIG